ncbi:hypothetical protein BDW62DRAFT_195884 [Aspergillus aurantiobrunneus]
MAGRHLQRRFPAPWRTASTIFSRSTPAPTYSLSLALPESESRPLSLVEENDRYRTLHHEKLAVRRAMLAGEMIAARYHESSTLTLKIYTEIANGASLDTTSAGRWLRYGNATGSSQGRTEAGAKAPTGSDSNPPPGGNATPNGQQRPQQQGHQTHSSSKFASGESWASQAVAFYEEYKPWIKLLTRAARVYMAASPGPVNMPFGDDLPAGFEIFVTDDPSELFEAVHIGDAFFE